MYSYYEVCKPYTQGFCSISPSVYIGFQTLEAYDLCGPLGGRLVNTTVAFASGELSTLVLYLPSHGRIRPSPQPLTVADLNQNCSTIAEYKWFPDNPSNTVDAAGETTKDPCHPLIAVSSRILALDPAWASCAADGVGGFYDPPHALTTAAGLDPATEIGRDPPSTNPAPGPTPRPITASITTVASTTLAVPPSSHNVPAATQDPSTANGGTLSAPSSSANANPQPQPNQNQPSQSDPGKSNLGQNQQSGNDPSGNLQPPNQQSEGDLSRNPQPGTESPVNQQSGNAPSGNKQSGNQQSSRQQSENLQPGDQHSRSGNQQGQSSVQVVIVQEHTISENDPVLTTGGSAVACSSGSIYSGNTAAAEP